MTSRHRLPLPNVALRCISSGYPFGSTTTSHYEVLVFRLFQRRPFAFSYIVILIFGFWLDTRHHDTLINFQEPVHSSCSDKCHSFFKYLVIYCTSATMDEKGAARLLPDSMPVKYFADDAIPDATKNTPIFSLRCIFTTCVWLRYCRQFLCGFTVAFILLVRRTRCDILAIRWH